jgi:hypothetical protein
MKYLLAWAALACALPAAASGQRDVTRRAYTFLEDRLVVAVHADAPGELQVMRGQRGRIEVAARAQDGFAGFGLGGHLTRELSLTAVGSDAVQYLVVVPEHVLVRVQLPDGGLRQVPTRAPVSTFRWGADDDISAHRYGADLLPSSTGGLLVVHSAARTPAVLDIPDLASVRSLSLRVQGDHFSIAASRPLAVETGNRDHLVVRVAGEPLDLVVYIPRSTSGLQVRAAGARVATVSGGRPRTTCGGAVHQSPTAHQEWLTLYPRSGRVVCR